MDREKLIKYVLKATRVLKMPEENISTFGSSSVKYYFLSGSEGKTKVREGEVVSRRPRIIVARDIKEIFEGFGDYPEKYTSEISNQLGKDIRVLNYRFKNSLENITSSSQSLQKVYERISKDISTEDSLNKSAVIKGTDMAWEISIMKFIVDYIARSAPQNLKEMEQKGMLPDSEGVPKNVRNRIEYLFQEARKNPKNLDELGNYLNEKGLFEQYEDRFFKLFKI